MGTLPGQPLSQLLGAGKPDLVNLIKQLDSQLSGGGNELYLRLNRGICYYQLGLHRKALKDVDVILEQQSTFTQAQVLHAKVLVGLKHLKEAKDVLQGLLSTCDLSAVDLTAAAEAHELLAGLENGSITPSTKIQLFRGITAPPRAAQPPSAKAAPAASLPSAPSPPAEAQPRQCTPPPTSERPMPIASAPAPPSTSPSPSQAAAPIDPMHRLMAMTDPMSAMGVAVTLVNNSNHAEALALLDFLIERHGKLVSMLAARGTARALLGDLVGAVGDFTEAIAQAPGEYDFYRRRAQALGALGREAEALEDLEAASRLAPTPAAAAEALSDVAKMRIRHRDYRRAEVSIRQALELDQDGFTADLLPLLASCQVSQGDLAEGAATYDSIIAVGTEVDTDVHINLGMALKELCRVDEAKLTLRRAALAGAGTLAEVNARRLLAQMLQGLGDHLGAVVELDTAMEVSAATEAQRVELRFLRGACHHAVGAHRQAVEDYQRTLEARAEGLSPDAMAYMCLAFYQKEMALWARAHLDDPVIGLCMDADLHPEFKELWCKKAPPGAEFATMYRIMMQPQRPDWDARRRRPAPAASDVKALLAAADALGAQVQYRHQGFLPNVRQRRMAGLAAVELAQLLTAAASARREGRPLPAVPDAGASVCARGPSGVGGGGRGHSKKSHPVGWRDAMEAVVKWRQVAEPNDQVLWVDLLTEREFSAGFGSHTPMFTGQTKCVRYHMNCARATAVLLRVAAEAGKVVDAENEDVALEGAAAAALAGATTAADMWAAVGRDFWVVVPVGSTTRQAQGHAMEGTRLTVVNLAARGADLGKRRRAAARRSGIAGFLEEDVLPVHGTEQLQLEAGRGGGVKSDEGSSEYPEPQPDSFEFSIRTPVTPARWEDYDEELAGMFECVVQALADGDKPAAADAALRFAYYWYNFMPLARGSALCGYVWLLAAFLAAGMPVRAKIPPSYQTDWEAILQVTPEAFIASLSEWMLPPELRDNAGGGEGGAAQHPWPCKPVEELPAVATVLATMRERVEALNGLRAPSI